MFNKYEIVAGNALRRVRVVCQIYGTPFQLELELKLATSVEVCVCGCVGVYAGKCVKVKVVGNFVAMQL